MSLSDYRHQKLLEMNSANLITAGPQAEEPPLKPDKPKRVAWSFEYNYPLKTDEFLESLTRHKSEINYSSKKAMKNLNNFFQSYGDDLYREKYNII